MKFTLTAASLGIWSASTVLCANQPIKLTSAFTERKVIHARFKVDPSSSSVVFVATPPFQQPGLSHFYEVSLSGGAITPLSDTVTFDLWDFLPGSPDIAYYRAPVFSDEGDIWRLSRPGGQLTNLTNSNNRVVQSVLEDPHFQITPDGSRLIYLQQTASNPQDLFSISASGGAAQKLSLFPEEHNGYVEMIHLTSDSQSVLYIANQNDPILRDLYRAPATGGPGIKVNTTPGIFNIVHPYALSPDQTRVLYHTNGRISSQKVRLFTAPITGGAELLLTPGAMAGEVIDAWFGGPDGSRAIYLANARVAAQNELYSVPITGGSSISISGPLPAGQSIYPLWNGGVVPATSPKTDLVGFMAYESNRSLGWLYLTSASHAQPRLLDTLQLSTTGAILSFDDAAEHLVVAKSNSGTGYTVISYSVEDGRKTVFGQRVERWLLHPDGKHILFTDFPDLITEDLFISRLDGTDRQLLSTETHQRFEVIQNFTLSPDGNTVVYSRGPEGDPGQHLYAVQIPEPGRMCILIVCGMILGGRRIFTCPNSSQSPQTFPSLPAARHP